MKGINNTEDIREELEFDAQKTVKRNEEARKIEEISKEILIISINSRSAIVNEINATKVAVWKDMKTRDEDKNEELVKETDIYSNDEKSKLAEHVRQRIWIHQIVEAAFCREQNCSW